MPERFTITRIEGITVPSPVFIVEDELTGRTREVTHDLEWAQRVAAWLNSGRTFDGEAELPELPVLQPA